MSKNSPTPPPPPTLPPAETPPPNPPPPTSPLFIELVQVDVSVLRESEEGESVTVRWQETPMTVTTLAGVHLGDVQAKDYDRVRLRRSSRSSIALIEIETIRCIVEVP